MKHILILTLAFFCLTVNAQNQVVRRQGAKKPTSTSTTKKQSASTTTKKASTTTKETASVSRGNKAKSSSSQSETLPRTAQQKNSYKTFTVNGVSFSMAKVEAGTFTMGATSEMENPVGDEKPAHQVTLTNNYYIGKTEVTQALWKAVMGSNPSEFKGDNKPVECVSWNDCQTFISKLNAATGKSFRLPTEAEWEFAARGGNNSRHYQYSGSNNLFDVAWYTENSSNTTHDVASKQANELGIYDMSGNVYEWCSDWYSSYSSNHQYAPAGPTSGSNRMLRGGSWYDSARFCRSSTRVSNFPDDRYRILGLRLALSESQSETLPRATRQEISYKTFTVKGVSFQMAKVVAGTFTMGATSEQQYPDSDEKPIHQVTLTNNYYIGKTEVTQALWKAVMGSNPSYFKGDNKPVEEVSWNDCQEFISRLNAATGKNFRLPTEAEWEFAARGGNNSRHFQYSGSNNLFDVAWYTDNSSNTTHDVASKQPNELGIYDMSGNVWEWCSDWYGSYSSNHQYDPAGPTSVYRRVNRGGSYYYGGARGCRSSNRYSSRHDDRLDVLGLRLALSE